MKDEFHKAGRSNSAPESLEVMKRYVQNNISFIVTFSVIVRIKYDHLDVNPFTLGVPLESIVCNFHTFEDNLGIELRFAKYLKESCCLASD